MKSVIVMSGISGAGKSTFIRREIVPGLVERDSSFAIVSADDYFGRTENEYGDRFNPHKLGEAHAGCFRDFLSVLQDTDVVIVDNTNTTSEEIAPYMLGAQAYGYNPRIITVVCAAETAIARNLHNVPAHAVEAQLMRLNKRNLPRHWEETRVHSGRGFNFGPTIRLVGFIGSLN